MIVANIPGAGRLLNHCRLRGLPRPAILNRRAPGDRRVTTTGPRSAFWARLAVRTGLKTQLLRPNWTRLNWHLARSIPVSATTKSLFSYYLWVSRGDCATTRDAQTATALRLSGDTPERAHRLMRFNYSIDGIA